MNGHAGTDQCVDFEKLATDLLAQGKRCAVAGLDSQALVLMVQAWTIAEKVNCGDSAAWEVGWLHVRTGSYREAAEWFGRVREPVNMSSELWPATRQAIVELCLHKVDESMCQTLNAPLQRSPEAPRPQTSLPPLVVTNLGHFQVVRGGSLLSATPSRKSVALFRYLLTCKHHGASRESITEQFWPDAGPREAIHSLHATVSRLRSYLDPLEGSYVVFEGGSYLINPDASVTEDCAVFLQGIDEAERSLQAGDRERARHHYVLALSYYTGDYVVDDHDSLWALAERERIITRYVSASDRLGRLLMDEGEFDRAIECFQRLLTRDPYREDVYARLIRCYLGLGRRHEALKQYEACAEILLRDLGLEPAAELQDLYQVITCSDSRSAFVRK